MKQAIFSLNIGNHPRYKPTLQSVYDYSKKIGVDFHLSTEFVVKAYNFYFEKLQAFSLFSEGYDQVLYIDADVLITPHAKNIFEKYSDPSVFYAYHENADSEAMNRDEHIEPLLPFCPDWPKEENNKYRYFNAGIMLFGRECFQQHMQGLNEPPSVQKMWEFGDQTFLNFLLSKNKVPFESFDQSFNRMNFGNPDPEGERFKANFIHYAGPCLYGNGDKDQVMKEDYEFLYGKDKD